MDGTGYSYTIGTGGSAVVALLRDYMAPWLLSRDAAMVEEIWKGLFFYTHASRRDREPCSRGRGYRALGFAL